MQKILVFSFGHSREKVHSVYEEKNKQKQCNNSFGITVWSSNFFY